jgi:hypothetical protein
LRRGLFNRSDGTRPLFSQHFRRLGMRSSHKGKQFPLKRLVQHLNHEGSKRKTIMHSRITNSSELIDHKTSRSICDAVGERLQQSLRPDSSDLSPYLQQLMDELRKQDDESQRPSSH